MKARAVILLGVCAIVGACATSRELARDAALDRASREYRCPREHVRLRLLSRYGHDYIVEVKACGYTTNYACYGNSDSGGSGCVKEGS